MVKLFCLLENKLYLGLEERNITYNRKDQRKENYISFLGTKIWARISPYWYKNLSGYVDAYCSDVSIVHFEQVNASRELCN